MRRIKLSLSIPQAKVLRECADQMMGDMQNDPKSVGYSTKDARDFMQAMSRLRRAITAAEDGS
jgi:hypothetical protein